MKFRIRGHMIRYAKNQRIILIKDIKEVYLVTTVNFIYNGIHEQTILDIISSSFKLK